MSFTFIKYLIESTKATKSVELTITLVDQSDNDISTDVELTVDYALVDDGQNYDHEDKTFEIDPESIEYIVRSPFSYKGIPYKKGFDLSELYDDVFIDDEYKKSLGNSVSNYHIKSNLSMDDKEEAFNDLLVSMIK